MHLNSIPSDRVVDSSDKAVRTDGLPSLGTSHCSGRLLERFEGFTKLDVRCIHQDIQHCNSGTCVINSLDGLGSVNIIIITVIAARKRIV